MYQSIEPTLCTHCDSILNEQDIFCPNCGYPERANQKEKDKFNYNLQLKKDIVIEAKKKMRNVKILLGVIAGLNLLVGFFYLNDDDTFAEGIAGIIAAVLFFACILWVNKQPVVGIVAAFAFWGFLQLISILAEPTSLFKGIFLKVIFAVIFVKGIQSARDYKNYQEQLKKAG